jgi:hypothetical protein
MANFTPETLDEESFQNVTSNDFKTLLIKILGNLVSPIIIDNIVNIFDTLPNESREEIQLRIDDNMITQLQNADQQIASLTEKMNTIARDKWTMLLGNIAKLQGLLILKRVKKIQIDSSQGAKDALIKELIDAFNAKLGTVNDILLTDLNSSADNNNNLSLDNTYRLKNNEVSGETSEIERKKLKAFAVNKKNQ